ncbi:LysR substrate-binding domain-containing protein [Vibrio aquimaris]|uniref:Glycine cleavage system transcriptional activator n=1 Tax=Vibrio aquimaris TaxID=2587862 RepID=A0A5P9CGW9_9VIBR|nr:LysR substrate-binding domain-containing protein [Vibrio aquimaris]QFT25446.1 Glycine cleavage system transcriptional activator [Vibrio aquimaris]
MKSSLLSGVHLVSILAPHQSLSSAASNLNITTGAVSQQLQLAEERLGFEVFERHARGIRLTDLGRKLLDSVNPHLTAIEEAIEKLSKEASRKPIRLKLTPSLAYKWLVPRLDDFQKSHPNIQVQVFAEGALVNSSSRDFDIAIDYGPIPYKLGDAELLMQECLIPVMSPDYFNKVCKTQNTGPQLVWESVTLLHDAMPWQGAQKDQEWRYWAQKHQLELDVSQGHFFNRTDMAMAAAEAGVGVALARKALLNDEIKQKRLVAPLPAIGANAGYFIITHCEASETQLFKSWLKQQVVME